MNLNLNDKKRIVIIGDSFTYGHGLKNEYSYPRVLERLLNGSSPDARFEVLNLGVGGIDIDEIYQVALYALKELKPDFLIYGYFLNDPVECEVVEPSVKGRLHESEWAHMEIKDFRVAVGGKTRSRPYLKDLLLHSYELSRISGDTIKWYRYTHMPENWKFTETLIEQIDAAAAGQNCRFMTALLPVIYKMDDYPLKDVHAGINKTLSQHNIKVIDCLPFLKMYRDSELYLHPRDRHPNAVYCATVAKALCGEINPQAEPLRK